MHSTPSRRKSESPPDDVFNSPLPPDHHNNHDSSPASSSNGEDDNNISRNLTVTWAGEDPSSVADVHKNHSTSSPPPVKQTNNTSPSHNNYNPFRDDPLDKEPEPPKFIDCSCQTDIRLGEWLLRDGSVSRSAYLEITEQLRKERIHFLKEASLIRQTLGRLDAVVNRSGGGAGGGSSSAAKSALQYRNSLSTTTRTTTTAVDMMNATTTNNNTNTMMTATIGQSTFLNVSNSSAALNRSTNNNPDDGTLDVSMTIPNLGRSHAASAAGGGGLSPVSALDQSMMTQTNNNNNVFGGTSNVSPLRGRSPPSHQQHQTTAALGGGAVISPVSAAQQRQIQHSSTIQATANTVMQLMNEAAKALGLVHTIEELEEKHAADKTELRMKMTEEMNEMRKKHAHDMQDIESELNLLRTEAESAQRTAVLERERLIHQMERTTWDTVQALKNQVKNLEGDLDEQFATMHTLKNDNRDMKKELQRMKADQIILNSEKRRLEQRLGIASSSNLITAATSDNANNATEDNNNTKHEEGHQKENNNNNKDENRKVAASSSSFIKKITGKHSSHHILDGAEGEKKQVLRIMDIDDDHQSGTPPIKGRKYHQRGVADLDAGHLRTWGRNVAVERESERRDNISRYDGSRIPPKNIHNNSNNNASLTTTTSPRSPIPDTTQNRLLMLTMKEYGIDDKKDNAEFLENNMSSLTNKLTPQRPQTARVINPPRVASMTSAAADQARRGKFSIGIGGRGGDVAKNPKSVTSTTARINNTIGKDIWGTRNEKRRIKVVSSNNNNDSVEKQQQHENNSEDEGGNADEVEYRKRMLGGETDVVLYGGE